MSFIRSNIDRNSLLGVISLAVFLLILLLPATVEAAKYFVLGRVYSAFSLAEDQEPPNNPLSDVPPEEIIGEDLFAVVPRNLVEVRVVAESNGSLLGSCGKVKLDGGYYIDFDAASGGIEVRFSVEELATNKILLNSDPVELSEDLPAWPPECNTRYLLVPEGVTPEGVIEIGNDREYAPGPAPPYTAIFTRVGKIEVETEVEGTPYRQIDTSTGLVNVDPLVAAQLHIPEYQDAPLGGNLYIFGAFSKDLYDMPLPNDKVYYRILIEPGSTYMDAPLFKTKYTVDFNTGTVNTERVKLGPWEIDGYLNCYELTPIAASNNEFWSFPDLVALWPTGDEGLNGNYKITLEAIYDDGVNPPAPLGGYVPISDFTDLRLRLDNIPPVAEILPLGAEDADNPTPRVYTPDPPSATISGDLTGTFEGIWPDHYGGPLNPICAILDLRPTGTETLYLAFRLKAYHKNGTKGYLRKWYFKYKRNDTGYQTHIGKKYDGATMTMVDDTPVQLSSSEASEDGFQDRYLYLKSSDLQPGGITDVSCGYRFLIGAFTRTTDGYHYLRRRWDEDIHCIELPVP
jgi:hypothetical protein